MSSDEILHHGGCHCSAVRFQVLAPKVLHVFDCNCSICDIKSNIHFIVPSNKFTLLKGKENLTTYTFNTHKAKHLFCKTCGVQSFYQPRSNPDGYGVNPRCLDKGTVERLVVEKIDGQNWEAAMEDQLKKPNPIQSLSK